MYEHHILAAEKYIRTKALKLCNGPLARSFLAKLRTEHVKKVYTIKEEIVDEVRAPPTVRRYLTQPLSLEMCAFNQFKSFRLQALPSVAVLKKESARVIWIPIFNAAVESIYRP